MRNKEINQRTKSEKYILSNNSFYQVYYKQNTSLFCSTNFVYPFYIHTIICMSILKYMGIPYNMPKNNAIL